MTDTTQAVAQKASYVNQAVNHNGKHHELIKSIEQQYIIGKIMTEDEICDMVIECIKAAKENKRFQYCSPSTGKWVDVYNPIITNIIASIIMGTKYRVKPEPQTVSVRMYWIKDSDKPRLAVDVNFDMVQSSPLFHDWAGDEQILTVPEV